MARFLGIGHGTGTLDLSTYTIIKASCSGTAAATSLAATAAFVAGQRLFICQMRGTSVGVCEDNVVASYVSGTVTLVYPLENTYTDSGASQAQVVVVPDNAVYTNSITVPSWDGNVGGLFVVACSGDFGGIIVGDGAGYRGGVGNAAGYGNQGEGTAGAGTNSSNANGNGGGGGARTGTTSGFSNDVGSGGGGGSNGAAGTNGGTHLNASGGTGGTAGSTVGQADLTTGIFMGGGGGGSGTDAVHTGKTGGNGGAIVVIYTKKMAAGSSVSVKGITGIAGVADHVGASGPGAGGTVFIRCTNYQNPVVNASGIALAVDGCASAHNSFGGISGDGRIRIETCSSTGTGGCTVTPSIVTGGFSYCGSVAYIF